MPAWTPAPWRLTTNKYDDDAPIIEMGSVTRRRVLYLTAGSDGIDGYDDEARATARLIAAAPDLYRACLLLRAAASADARAEARRVADTAIARAVGGEA